MKILLYCTKEKNKFDTLLPDEHFGKRFYIYGCPYENFHYQKINGSIVAECDCNLVEKFDVPYPAYFCEVEDKLSHITQKSCLSLLALHHYLGIATGYGLNLKNVKVFDKPKKLSDYLGKCIDKMAYCPTCKNGYIHISDSEREYCMETGTTDGCNTEWIYLNRVRKAPHNMMYVYDKNGNKYILVSIKPEPLCKILNGEKTIEIRKKILNDLKDLIKND